LNVHKDDHHAPDPEELSTATYTCGVYTGTLAVYGHHHSNHDDGWTLEAAVTQILQQVLHALTLPEEEDDNDNSSSHRLWWSTRLSRLGVTDLRGAPEHSGVRSAPASNKNYHNRSSMSSVFVGMGLTLLAAVLVGGAAALVRFLWLEQHVYDSRAQQEPQRGPTKQPSSTHESSTTGFRHDTGFWSHLMTFFRGGKDADDKTTADSYCDSMMSQAPSTVHSSTARRWRQRMVRAAHNNYGNDDSRRHAMLATVDLFAPAGEDGCDPDDPYIVEPDDDDEEWTDVWLGNSSGRNQVDDDDGEFSVLYQQDKHRGDEDPLKFPTVF